MKEFKGKLAGFPKEVVEKILKRENLTMKEVSQVESQRLHAGFSWESSKEGHDFWKNIFENRRFDAFFKKYPKKEKKTKPKSKKYQVKISAKDNIQTFPKEVFNKILENLKREGISKKEAVKRLKNDMIGAFDWSESVEGYDFWDNIDDGFGFDAFFEKYPKKTKKKKSKSLSLNEPIYRMNRRGSFNIDEHTSNQCGAEGLDRYEFEIVAILKQQLDSDGFVFDHDLIQKAIDDAYIKGSCEEIQKIIYESVSSQMPEGVLLGYKCVIKPLDFYVKAYIEYISCGDPSYYSLL